MNAIILAAGKGKMGADSLPVSLQEVQGKKIIDYQLAALEQCGVKEVIIVVGYKSESIKSYLGNRVIFIENPDYETTSSAYSLWLARDHGGDGFLYLNADLVFEPELLQKVLDSPHLNAFAYDRKYDFTSDMQKVVMIGERIVHHDKQVSADLAHGEAVGPVKISASLAGALFKRIGQSISAGNNREWVYAVLSEMAKCHPMHGVNITGLNWCEVDTLDDLSRVQAIFGPRQPFVVMMTGNPATGKTHTSKALQEYCSLFGRTALISTANLREEMGLVDLYSEEERKAIYDTMMERVRMVMEWKNSNLVLDGNFSKFSSRQKIYDLAGKYGYQPLVINCVVSSEDVIRQRLERRKVMTKNLRPAAMVMEQAAATMDLYYLIRDEGEPLENDLRSVFSLSILSANTETGNVSVVHAPTVPASETLTLLQNGIKYGFQKVPL